VNQYSTTDLHVAAFLLVRGHSLVRFDKPTFVFEASAAGDAKKYFENELVGSLAFGQSLRDLKRLIHDRRPIIRQ
jgi:hypothetical protein